MKVNGKDYPIYYGKIKNVPNHQPEKDGKRCWGYHGVPIHNFHICPPFTAKGEVSGHALGLSCPSAKHRVSYLFRRWHSNGCRVNLAPGEQKKSWQFCLENLFSRSKHGPNSARIEVVDDEILEVHK